MPARLATVVALMAEPGAARGADFVFRDAGDEARLFPDVTGIQGHGAAWGDVDGDGFLDLYAGTFHKEGTKPNLLLRNTKGKFRLDAQKSVQISSRTTGVVFADFDNDGDLDLYVASMPQPAKGLTGCTLFRNDGTGAFTDVSKDNGACPVAFGGRSATVLDFDGDGLLDILAGEDPLPGYNGSPTKSSRLFRNKGNLQFDDVSRAAGLPADVSGYGVAAADVNSVSSGQHGEAVLYAFNTKTEHIENLGPAAVGTQHYITSIDADATGRFLYYIPGAHGGSELDGSPAVQFDVKTRKKKVIAFLHPFCAEKYGCTLKGTFSSAISPSGDKLFITWNNSRGTKVWDSCLLTVIHIPESERIP